MFPAISATIIPSAQCLPGTSMHEQRRYDRSASSALVELHHPSFGMIEVKARDLSEGGVFVLMGRHPSPPVGTLLQVRIKRYTGVINQEPVPMRVVHHQPGGIGLAFEHAPQGAA
jgi:hypothetical protein